MKQQPEYILQTQVCAYLRAAYSDVLFMSDTIAAVRLTIPQQVRNAKLQKKGFKCPDILVFKPNGLFKMLFLELKAKDIYKKNGELLKNEHVEAQFETIKQLNSLGYFASFAVGFDEAKKIIDDYMKIK